MKKAFTLIEMLVVIGILGILSATLMGAFSGSTDKARTVKCATNLKNLAAAVTTYAMSGHYPYAQSALYFTESGAEDSLGVKYNVHKGWVSWLDQGTRYPLTSERAFTQPSFAGSNDDNLLYAVTNGAIWTAVGKHHDCYLCPMHIAACRKKGVQNPGWSYAMNAYFGYDRKPGQAVAADNDLIYSGDLTRADRMLLFAEIPALELDTKDKARTKATSAPNVDLTAGDGSAATDACLTYRSLQSGTAETIGFNHRRGKEIIGHVAFADGHVEALALPRNGNFTELTDWLCKGSDVVYRNGVYEEVKDSEVE